MAGISWESPDKTVLRLNLGKGWTWQFFDSLMDSAYALIRECSHGVALIIHDEELGDPVPHGSALAHFRRSAERIPANASFICVVAADRFTHAMISLLSIFNRNVRDRVAVVWSLDDAQKLVIARRSANNTVKET